MNERYIIADEIHSRTGPPPLSHSRINRYETCPESYRLYYVERIRVKTPSASLVFGSFVHQALAALFIQDANPSELFTELWNQVEYAEIQYNCRETWESLLERGKALLDQFVAEELPKIGDIHAVEQPFELAVSHLDVPLIGVVDLVADVNGEPTVVDFKTSGSRYDDHEIALSDQLTAYALAQPAARQSAYCVLVKTKQTRIEWHFARRTPEQTTAYLDKIAFVGQDIRAGKFWKRPGKHCSWCDYLELCLKH